MVMFHHAIPYAVARERGELQAAIVAALTNCANSLADIPVERMDAAVLGGLEPLPLAYRAER
jgi:hypothetical protein